MRAGAIVPESARGLERIGVGAIYLALGLAVLVRNRRSMATLLRDGFRTPYDDLVE